MTRLAGRPLVGARIWVRDELRVALLCGYELADPVDPRSPALLVQRGDDRLARLLARDGIEVEGSDARRPARAHGNPTKAEGFRPQDGRPFLEAILLRFPSWAEGGVLLGSPVRATWQADPLEWIGLCPRCRGRGWSITVPAKALAPSTPLDWTCLNAVRCPRCEGASPKQRRRLTAPRTVCPCCGSIGTVQCAVTLAMPLAAAEAARPPASGTLTAGRGSP